MKPQRLPILALLAATAAFAAAKPFPLTVQLDWIPEPEHGGLYQALARGFFTAEGLDVTLLPGGPNALVMPKVATGQVDIGQADSTNTLLQQAEGLPVVQFAAVFQDDPSGLLVNADSSVRTFADLGGKTIIARPEWAFLPFLQKKYHVHFNVVPQNFSVAAFLGDKEAIQQGYYIAEPYHIAHAGGKKPRFLSTWDAGFRAYAVLVTSRKFAREHPAELRAFTRAYIHGWRDYIEGDPTPAHEALKKANPNNTDEFMNASRQLIIEGQLVTGRDKNAGDSQIGRLDPARYATQIAQLEDLGILKKGKVTAAAAMTTDFLPAIPLKPDPATTDKFDHALQTELLGILDEDQKYRLQLDATEKKFGRDSKEIRALWDIINAHDAADLARVKSILDTRGWVGPDVVGEKASSALFFVIQHSDVKTQEHYLPLMRDAVKHGRAPAAEFAMLEDRVALREGRRQIYGSQLARDDRGGDYYLSPLEDPDHVDQRRAAVGLPPLADYLKHWNLTWDVAAYKKNPPALEPPARAP